PARPSPRGRPMRPSALSRHRLVVAVAACLWLLGHSLADPAVAQPVEPGDEWVPPVTGAVVRQFAEPISVYAAGHRGVDFAAAPGAPVRAANAGTVSFAGDVAGSLHVVVAH